MRKAILTELQRNRIASKITSLRNSGVAYNVLPFAGAGWKCLVLLSVIISFFLARTYERGAGTLLPQKGLRTTCFPAFVSSTQPKQLAYAPAQARFRGSGMVCITTADRRSESRFYSCGFVSIRGSTIWLRPAAALGIKRLHVPANRVQRIPVPAMPALP